MTKRIKAPRTFFIKNNLGRIEHFEFDGYEDYQVCYHNFVAVRHDSSINMINVVFPCLKSLNPGYHHRPFTLDEYSEMGIDLASHYTNSGKFKYCSLEQSNAIDPEAPEEDFDPKE